MTDNDVITAEPTASAMPTFKRSFWILFAAIVIAQIAEVLLTIRYWPIDSHPAEFHFFHELFAAGWYILLLCAVSLDLWLHDLSLIKAINFDIRRVSGQIPTIIKYFLGTSLVVIALSFLQEGTELGLENQSEGTILLSFGTAVLMAPVVEEIAFRGYLYPSMFLTFKRKKERLVVNAMLFASAHVFLVAFFLGAEIPYYVFVLGYLLASLYEESRSVVPGIILHALNNGLVFAIDMIKLSAIP